MKHVALDQMRARLGDQPVVFHEFLREDSMSAGLYRIEAGAVDPQEPHSEDEIYFIIAGQGKLSVDGVVCDVAAGDFVYVPAMAEHRFHDVVKTLEILVIFAPAEYSKSE